MEVPTSKDFSGFVFLACWILITLMKQAMCEEVDTDNDVNVYNGVLMLIGIEHTLYMLLLQRCTCIRSIYAFLWWAII